MDYKEQAENLLYDAKDWAGDPHIKKDLSGAAQSITDLLSRAEAAEARCKLAEKCFDDSALHACETQLELEKKARLEAEARAEKAERERDECKAKYCAKEPCTTCIHYEEKDCDGDCLSCTADCPCNKCEEYSMWAWNGKKEE